MAMNSARVVSGRFPYVPITLDVQGRIATVEALLDTGFDGHVVVPPALVTDGQAPDGHLDWFLADGSQVVAPYFLGTLAIGAIGPFPVLVTVLGDEALVGQQVAIHLTITLDHGRSVIVEP